MRWLATLLLAGLALLAWALIAAELPQVTVENRTGLRIERMELLVESSSAQLEPQGGYDRMRQVLPMRAEGPVRLRIQFEGERERTLDAGWFAPGQTGEAVFVLVTPDSIQFELR